MSDQFFADAYRAASFNPQAEIVSCRSEAFDGIKDNLTDDQYLDCVRLYFALPIRGELIWLRDAFFATDNTFSLVNNDREVTLLGTLLLVAAVEEDSVLPALAVLSAYAFGLRKPVLRPELVAEAEEALNRVSVDDRRFSQLDMQKLREVPGGKSAAATDAYAESNTAELLIAAIKAAAADGRRAASAIGAETADILDALSSQMLHLREEQSILWWFTGGHSGLISARFADLKVGPAAVLLGAELATMTTPPGPVSAPALMQRMLATTQHGKGSQATLSEIVSAFDDPSLTAIIGNTISIAPELTPVFTGIDRAKEIGAAPSWHQAFTKLTDLDPALKLSPLQICVQTYRERLLLEMLADGQ